MYLHREKIQFDWLIVRKIAAFVNKTFREFVKMTLTRVIRCDLSHSVKCVT